MGSYIEDVEKAAENKYRHPILKMGKSRQNKISPPGPILKMKRRQKTKYRQWGPILKMLKKCQNKNTSPMGPVSMWKKAKTKLSPVTLHIEAAPKRITKRQAYRNELQMHLIQSDCDENDV
ncbi:hypothetical protein AVEN_86519-1 [Araneus ventricosus]|uniref:Uncharacterized protein n=1 Tax=Araneus ventricosus TaxID=182803 RepID=A0A4Y2PX79_ARAVE|nr:hypothetical protein AVEN_86519-1 [Araneus ventricosus]